MSTGMTHGVYKSFGANRETHIVSIKLSQFGNKWRWAFVNPDVVVRQARR